MSVTETADNSVVPDVLARNVAPDAELARKIVIAAVEIDEALMIVFSTPIEGGALSVKVAVDPDSTLKP